MYINYECPICKQIISITELDNYRSMCCGHYFPILHIEGKEIMHSGCTIAEDTIVTLKEISKTEIPDENSVLVVDLEEYYTNDKDEE